MRADIVPSVLSTVIRMTKVRPSSVTLRWLATVPIAARRPGSLSSVRADDLGAVPLKALMARNTRVDWQAVSDVIFGCANQAGEDNRNVARMASLLAGLPIGVPGATINRLCGSGMDAVGTAARAIKSGEAQLMIAGGVESMSRAPFVMPKAETAFSRNNAVYDTTIGWRFVNKLMKELHGVDSMPETAENVAAEFKIEREAQDRMALASQLKAVAAQKSGFFDAEITPVTIAQKKGEAIVVAKDEHPRETSLDALAKLKGVVQPDGTVTAGNASGVNDGACALLLANEASAARHGLTPRARVVGHPLGASGARLVTTAVNQLQRSGGRYALCTMCIGVGQGIALVVERV